MRKQPLLLAYHCLSLFLFPFFCIFLLLVLIRRPPYRRGMGQRFGWYTSDFFQGFQGKEVFWIHAVSVGEVMMSRTFIRALRECYPEAGMVLSTITPSGQETARKQLPELDLYIYMPLDLLWIVRSVVRRMKPTLFIFFETEIWINCLKTLSEQQIPSVMINGRISDRSFPRYQMLRPFISAALDQVSAFLMQSEQDAARIIRLGAPRDRVERTGNMKYDQAISEKNHSLKKNITLKTLGLLEDDRLMIAGSTRPGEEEAMLEAYQILRPIVPSLMLLIAPRHLQRLDEVERLISRHGFRPIRKQMIAGRLARTDTEKPVILLDTLGELEGIYPLGEFIFVGGGLAPLGGHNPLEVAAHGKPVFFGPHMSNFREIAAQLKSSGGGIEVVNGKEMGEKMAWLAQNPVKFRERGEAAMQVVLKHRGAVHRNLDRLSRWIDPPDIKKNNSRPILSRSDRIG